MRELRNVNNSLHNFMNDYSEIAAPEILERLLAESGASHNGYGLDLHSRVAADRIRQEIEAEHAAVHFLVGGTQTNMILISSVLRSYEAVISASTGHINVHETGAIEGQGHKILLAETADGKLRPDGIRRILAEHTDEHMVRPRLVYLSQTTELGTIYRRAELEAIRSLCLAEDLYLYIDGARLGSALTADSNDLDLPTLASLCDAFTIGGTKNGLMFGEALVLMKPDWQEHFRYEVKHLGGMLAKGFVAGIQFDQLFTNRLFYRLAEHANKQATKLADALRRHAVPFHVPAESNQLFVIFTPELKAYLAEQFSFSLIAPLEDGRTVVRLVTSWATSDEAVDAMETALEAYHGAESEHG